jgi:hypothetical protein
MMRWLVRAVANSRLRGEEPRTRFARQPAPVARADAHGVRVSVSGRWRAVPLHADPLEQVSLLEADVDLLAHGLAGELLGQAPVRVGVGLRRYGVRVGRDAE